MKLEFRDYKFMLVAGTHKSDSHREADANNIAGEVQKAEKMRMELL